MLMTVSSPAIPRLTRPLIGFRTWRIVDGELRSPYDGAVWTADGLSARCRPRNAEDLVRTAHAAPEVGCSCGISATSHPDMDANGIDASSVVGAVALWGRVVMHDGAFRAEHAQIVELGAYLHWSRRQRIAAAHVAEQFGCRLVPLEALGETSAEALDRQESECDRLAMDALPGAAPVLVLARGPATRFVRAR